MINKPSCTFCYSANGEYLFDGQYKAVRIWHHDRFVGECPGEFVGAARDGKTFLTYNPDEGKSCRAWQSHTGINLPISAVQPEHYAPNQRYFLERTVRPIVLRDALGREAPIQLDLDDRDYMMVDNWALSPDGNYLAVAFFFDVGGHDGAFGRVYARLNGSPFLPAFQFDVDRFISTPLVTSCDPHTLFAVSAETGRLSLITATGQYAASRIRYVGGGGRFLIVSPKTPRTWVVHYNSRTWRLVHENKNVDVAEDQPILAAAFHPSGEKIAILLENLRVAIYSMPSLQRLGTLPNNKFPLLLASGSDEKPEA